MLVKIKSWDKMVKKYGIDGDGDIYRENKNFYFPKELKHICDTEVELEVCDEDYKSLLGKYQGYYIEKWMVK